MASSTPSGLNAASVIQSVCLSVSQTMPLSAVECTRTVRFGPPTTTIDRSGETSAARIWSYSLPALAIRSPVTTSHRTASPRAPPRPPAASSTLPLRLNRSTCGWPSGKPSVPSGSAVSKSHSVTCSCPATAAIGSHGLTASAVTLLARAGESAGSPRYAAGRSGPSGRTVVTSTFAKAGFGLDFFAFEPAFSSSPCSIHALMTASSASGMRGELGGITGCSSWLTTIHRYDESMSPANTTSPEPPPSINAA